MRCLVDMSSLAFSDGEETRQATAGEEARAGTVHDWAASQPDEAWNYGPLPSEPGVAVVLETHEGLFAVTTGQYGPSEVKLPVGHTLRPWMAVGD